MSRTNLTASARRFLADRLDRLQQALEVLASRLREGIASVVSGQIGDAVRDALQTALGRAPQPVREARGPYAEDNFEPSHRIDRSNELSDEGLSDCWYEYPRPSVPQPSTPAHDEKPSRWRAVFAGGLHLAAWWCKERLARRPAHVALGVAGVTAVACLANPLAAGVVAAGGAAVWLTGIAGGLRRLAGRLVGAGAT